MKQKRHRYRNRHLAIRGNPLFGQRICQSKKGKGSYDLKQKRRETQEVF